MKIRYRTKYEQIIILGCCVQNMNTLEEIVSYRNYIKEVTTSAAIGTRTSIRKDTRNTDEYIADLRVKHRIGNPSNPNIEFKIKQGKEHKIEPNRNEIDDSVVIIQF